MRPFMQLNIFGNHNSETWRLGEGIFNIISNLMNELSIFTSQTFISRKYVMRVGNRNIILRKILPPPGCGRVCCVS